MSRYQLILRQQNGLSAYILRDHQRRAEAVLYPELGNNCVEFRTTPDPDGDSKGGEALPPVDIFVATDDLESLKTHPFHSGQPILFPFPNRVREGKFSFEGESYFMKGLLEKGWDKGAGQAIHGLVADRAWTVEFATADDLGVTVRSSLQLDAIPDIYEQYPFRCKIAVTYTLKEGVLEMLTEVTNTGDKTLPMGFGIHPWFPVVLRPALRTPAGLEAVTAEDRGKAQVQVPAASIWQLEKLMPTGEVVSAENTVYDLREWRALETHFFDNVFTQVEHAADGWSSSGVRDTETGLEMYIAADGTFREWVLYAPLERRVVALEPYTCTTDAVNLEPQGVDAGLIALPVGEVWAGTIKFGLRRIE